MNFRLDLRKVPASVWLLLGRASALCERLANSPMPPREASTIDLRLLGEGVLASAAMEGNTLRAEQVTALLRGTLDLPPAQQYLKAEVENLAKAVRWTEDRVRSGDLALTPWTIQLFNAQVLKGLPWDEEVRPGEWRTGVSGPRATGGAPAEDLDLLMERLCDWLSGPVFDPEPEEERLPLALVKAAMAHLYLLWLAPFGEGNGRTARCVEHQVLLSAGVPPRAALLPTIGLDRIRSAYFKLPGQCARTNDPLPFLGSWVRAFVDELALVWEAVEAAQRNAAWTTHLEASFAHGSSRHATRQRQLLHDLLAAPGPVMPGRIPGLSTALAQLYAPLHPKTLQRDLEALAAKGFLERTEKGVRALAIDR
ncbi:MAG: Fic family protein [Flavobacteriales bacterium]|nr:Fic family protein [Flavobacteriales bacterium]